MTLRMKAEIRDLWADALESGEYEQTKGVLATIGYGEGGSPVATGFCCLGVLCDLAVKAGAIPEPSVTASEEWGECLLYGTGSGFGHDSSYSALPAAVVQWAGLAVEGEDSSHDPENPKLVAADGSVNHAAEWNDEYQATFTDIAEMVRAIPATEPANV